jgi:isopenicillin-N epimerase
VNSLTGEFLLEPGLTYLNHASFGCPTVVGLDRAEAQRRRIELDTAVALGPQLVVELTRQADAVAATIGADSGSVALVENTTAAAGALWASLPWSADTRVFALDVEYESVIRGLEVACARVGAMLYVAHLPLPATEEAVLAALAAARPVPTVVVMSAVTSSTAVAMPLRAVARWCAVNGAQLLIDAAHVVGHVPVDVANLGAAAVFGSLHKWLPVPRSIGFLWLSPELRDVVRPAEVSLRWDSEDVVERFGWRGTWDPASALGVEAALAELAAWDRAGELTRAREVADHILGALRDLGLRPTADEGLAPPRLRGFLVPGVELADLRSSLDACKARAWTGRSADEVTILRVSTHVYNDTADAVPLVAALRSVLNCGTMHVE